MTPRAEGHQEHRHEDRGLEQQQWKDGKDGKEWKCRKGESEETKREGTTSAIAGSKPKYEPGGQPQLRLRRRQRQQQQLGVTRKPPPSSSHR